MELDPPEHTKYRRLLTEVFSPAATESRRPRIEEICRDDPDPVEHVLDPLERVMAGASDQAEYLVSLVEEELGKVGAVLARDPGDQRAGHQAPNLPASQPS